MPGLLQRLGLSPDLLPSATLVIAGEPVAISFRRNAKAKRLILRLTKCRAGVVVTLPRRASRNAALAFAEKSSAWIEGQRAKLKPQRCDQLLYRGVEHEFCATGERRGLIRIDAESRTIHVPGGPAHAPRRLGDWLKREARRELEQASLRYAGAMGVNVKAISIRDQSSRWGSCSAEGRLSYSWRLILAPPYVLDYVAAHEVAHRIEMNHGPAFWRIVLTHCPHSKEAKRWLKQHGRELHVVLS